MTEKSDVAYSVARIEINTDSRVDEVKNDSEAINNVAKLSVQKNQKIGEFISENIYGWKHDPELRNMSTA